PRTGSRSAVVVCSPSRGSGSRGRRRAATASPRVPSANCTTSGSPIAWKPSSASTDCARWGTGRHSSSRGPSIRTSRHVDTSCAGASSTRWSPSARSRPGRRCGKGRKPRRLLSTFAGWKEVNTTTLMQAFCETAPRRWGIGPDTATCAPTGGRLPTGGSVLPRIGPTFLVVGDAAGSVNPFNGEGISVAYETGRLAADAVDLALATDDGLALQTYEARLEEVYGLYFKVARAFVRAIGNPAVMRELTRIGMQSRTIMEWALRIMANLLRPDELGPAEAAYGTLAQLVRLAPEP